MDSDDCVVSSEVKVRGVVNRDGWCRWFKGSFFTSFYCDLGQQELFFVVVVCYGGRGVCCLGRVCGYVSFVRHSYYENYVVVC